MALHWAPAPTIHLAEVLLRGRIEKAEEERNRIRQALEGLGEDDLRPLLDRANAHLEDVRLIGDAVVATFFAGDRRRAREEARVPILEAVEAAGIGWQTPLRPLVAALRSGDKPIDPFHFEVELPEVFDRENAGFDVVVGNPPFAGHVTIVSSNRENFTSYLRETIDDTRGKCDSVGYFFRRAYTVLRNGGCLGLLATKTLRQGETRYSGLRWILKHGGEIYQTRRRIPWPGEAAVMVCVVLLAARLGDQETAVARGAVQRPGLERIVRRVLGAHRVVRAQGNEVFRTLAERLDADPAIEATLCLDIGRRPGDTSIEQDVVARFADRFARREWPGRRLPSLYYDPRSLRPAETRRASLHAKCIVIDGCASLVTSANFTEAAHQRNIELGLLVRSTVVGGQIESHFRAMIDRGTLLRVPTA
jgi:hypothetical protein